MIVGQQSARSAMSNNPAPPGGQEGEEVLNVLLEQTKWRPSMWTEFCASINKSSKEWGCCRVGRVAVFGAKHKEYARM